MLRWYAGWARRWAALPWTRVRRPPEVRTMSPSVTPCPPPGRLLGCCVFRDGRPSELVYEVLDGLSPPTDRVLGPP